MRCFVFLQISISSFKHNSLNDVRKFQCQQFNGFFFHTYTLDIVWQYLGFFSTSKLILSELRKKTCLKWKFSNQNFLRTSFWIYNVLFSSSTWTSVHILAAIPTNSISIFGTSVVHFCDRLDSVFGFNSFIHLFSVNLRYFDCLRMDKAAGKPDHDSDFVYTSASVWSHSSKSMHKETSDKKRQTNSICVYRDLV